MNRFHFVCLSGVFLYQSVRVGFLICLCVVVFLIVCVCVLVVVKNTSTGPRSSMKNKTGTEEVQNKSHRSFFSLLFTPKL